MASYYILRPVRDQMGIAGGVKNLPNLFTVTFVVMLIAQPVYGALVARVSRAKFIPIVYHFFVLNLAIFWALLHFNINVKLTAQAFFVWISVFNLFAVAVFWSFMADLYESEQSKRLFGFVEPERAIIITSVEVEASELPSPPRGGGRGWGALRAGRRVSGQSGLRIAACSRAIQQREAGGIVRYLGQSACHHSFRQG